MCYTSASAARAGAIQALRSGIMILLIPSLLMLGAISVVIYRARNRFREEPEGLREPDREFNAWLTRMERVEGLQPPRQESRPAAH